MTEQCKNFYMLSGGTEIGENANLDDYQTTGNYYCPGNGTISTLKNCPTGAYAFTMKVESSVGFGYPCQTLRRYIDGLTYYRLYNRFGGGWTEWKRFTPV